MTSWREFRAALALGLATSLAVTPARALVTLNDGHDKIFVNGSMSVSRDSNVFANSDNRGDYVYSTSLSAEYTRRAGWIGVNANAAVSSSRFGTIEGQDFNNPSFGLEFTKQSGRTTGSLTFSAARESRADASVNVRSSSWNIPVGLNFKYPIAGTYTLAGSFGYSSRRYLDETVFASLTSLSASLDVFHILTSERDMLVGYRYRHNETSRDTSSADHAFSLGINGKLIRGVSGSLRVGYQVRIPRTVLGEQPAIKSWTISSPASFSISKKLNLNGSIGKDLAITATDSFVDTTTASIDTQYAYNSHLSFTASATFGDSKFLGESGRIVLTGATPAVFDFDGTLLVPAFPAVLGKNRHDNYFTWSANLGYSLNEHFKAMLTYSWFKNWSTIEFADFVRSSWTLSLSSRW